MLRKRKNRRYNETTDEDGERKFNLQDKIKSKRFDLTNREKHLLELSGQDVNLRLMQERGFERPILVSRPDGLDLRVPPKSFLVRNVRDCVGHDRLIDVMDVRTQKNIEMSMKDWCKYYESRLRDRLLNVISLEFSHTKLDELVDSPMIVKLLDWVDLVWPKFLKESQTESTNSIDKMKYPKVQKYCLMSVKGSYTDFHIDFGGTSVWYHILRGKKIFWMVPPTDLNLSTFEEWTLSGSQQTVFFGDTVEECFRVELEAGNTFFIPSGWIHAVYTLEDSLVFGGNFLHSFGIENQLRVSKIEDSTKVPVKFRYPFYTEILWYVVQHYVYCLTGKNHLHKYEATVPAIESNEKRDNNTSTVATDSKQQEKKAASNESGEDDGEDQSTESEEEDKCDSRKRKVAPKKRGKKAATPAKNSAKRPKKPPTDDESTEIDSAAEESAPSDKPTTCRMTKNSLLRLQYELEEKELQQQLQKAKSSSSSKPQTPQKADKGSAKKTTAVASKAPKAPQAPSDPPSAASASLSASSTAQSSSATSNATGLTAPQESSTLNGWSAVTGATQIGWSAAEPESKDPPRIHLTKYELNGLKALVKHLSKLSGAKKHVPSLIKNTRFLLDDCKKMIAEHEHDIPELAITGKPVTPELLNMKRADINEMIKQFFKPSNDSEAADETSSQSALTTTSSSSKIKFNSDISSKGSDDKKSTSVVNVSSSSNNSTTDNEGHAPKSPTKDIKCLSPNKKLSISSSTTSNSSPPPRPKSPPTRPLSNNQYTSKTKNNNNLLLPGSFADLIAATSTEKKAFDVSGADVTNSLFGTRDSANKPAPKATTSKIKKELSPSITDTIKKQEAPPLKSSTSPDIPASTSASSDAIDRHCASQQPAHLKPNSPEPPKTQPVQKRFINPAFRPHSKEKLIFASAPYVSPVHASDQSRLPNHPYPWQTPAPHQATPTATKPTHSFGSASPTIQASSSSPFVSDQQKPTSSNHAHQASVIQTMSQADKPKSDAPQAAGNSETRRDSSGNLEKDGHHRPHVTPATRGEIIVMKPQQFHTAPHQARTKADLKSQQQQNAEVAKRESPVAKAKDTLSADESSAKHDSKQPTPSISGVKPSEAIDETKASDSSSTAAKSTISENEQKAKKPTKPRGPPKKSKEARQAIEFADVSAPVISKHPVAVPISVVGLAPQTSVITSLQTVAQVAPQQPQQPTQAKPKAKRTKKQKNETAPATTTSSIPTFPTATTLARPQIQPSVICGLVTQPQTGTAQSGLNTKISPQQYLISRPLMFNTMPTMSTAQFQQMSRASLPIITNPGITSLGMPLQQGARIVWATQPRAMAAPITNQPRPTTSAGTSQAGKSTPTTRPPVTSSDNAALLSLATTALSTAPMTHSSPSLVSHMGTRAPTSQAIMVSSPSGQAPTFLAGQQLFRPLVQRMPMTHFVSRPGAPRPTSGQLVFARLPNQNQQARFLITNPGLMTQRLQAPQLVAGQPNPTLAFATFKPSTDTSKAIKTKKVKTS